MGQIFRNERRSQLRRANDSIMIRIQLIENPNDYFFFGSGQDLRNYKSINDCLKSVFKLSCDILLL
jgi:hypothetical protein